MNCPVCNKTMIQEDFGNIIVDVCRNGCRGMWFDWFELSKLDEKNEGVGQALEEALKYPRVNDENRGRINCPKCGMPMYMHKYKSAKEITVDECGDCGGFFIDSGELKAIRDNYMTKQEAEEYMQKLLAEVPAYSEKLQDIKRKKARSDAIDRWTRFLRISYYLTGK